MRTNINLKLIFFALVLTSFVCYSIAGEPEHDPKTPVEHSIIPRGE